MTTVRLARDATRERVLCVGGCNWNSHDVLIHIQENSHFNSCRFAGFPIESRLDKMLFSTTLVRPPLCAKFGYCIAIDKKGLRQFRSSICRTLESGVSKYI